MMWKRVYSSPIYRHKCNGQEKNVQNTKLFRKPFHIFSFFLYFPFLTNWRLDSSVTTLPRKAWNSHYVTSSYLREKFTNRPRSVRVWAHFRQWFLVCPDNVDSVSAFAINRKSKSWLANFRFDFWTPWILSSCPPPGWDYADLLCLVFSMFLS